MSAPLDAVVVGTDDALRAQLAGLPARRELRVETVSCDAPTLLKEAAQRLDAGAAAFVSGQVVVPDEGLLRVLDDPALRVAALVATRQTGHAVATDGSLVLSAATALHPVVNADAGAVGAVYVSTQAAPEVAAALRAVPGGPAWTRLDPLDLLLAAVVRSGVPTAAVWLDPLPGGRGAWRAEVDAVDARDLAARGAARSGDGFYSTFVLRKIAARITPWAVRQRVSANAVTAVSAALGLLGAAAFALGAYPALLAGAALLQLSILLDCVDGEIARTTRTRTAFGAWLDAATDRLKEYAALAGLAAACGLWWVGAAAMVVQTARHLVDFAFAKGVLAGYVRARSHDTRPLGDTAPWTAPIPRSSRSMWLRRMLHMPIGERWLVLCVAAALDAPAAGLVGYLALAVLSGAWTTIGAVRRTTAEVGRYDAATQATLAGYRDDGPLGRPRAPRGVLGWLLPPAVTLVEGGLAVGLTAATAPHWLGAAFGYFAVVAWHRYDVIYRRGGSTPQVPAAVSALGGGWALRSAVLAAGAVAGVLPAVLLAATAWLIAVYLPESLLTGVRTAR